MSAGFVIVCSSGDNSLGLYELTEPDDLQHLGDVPLAEVGAPNGSYPMALSHDRNRATGALDKRLTLPAGRIPSWVEIVKA